VLDADRFIVGGPSNSGGIVLDWLYHSVLSRNPTDRDAQRFVEMIAAAQTVQSDDLLCLPYVAGARAPLWNADATGRLLWLTVTPYRASFDASSYRGHHLECLLDRLGVVSRTGATTPTQRLRQSA